MGFEVEIYDTRRCTNLHILTTLFTKSPSQAVFSARAVPQKYPVPKTHLFLENKQ